MKIKVSGITNLEDAMDAISLGVDAVGFIFYDSPWQVDLQDAKEIAAALPPLITRVGVFKDEDQELVNTIMSSTGMDVIQLDGSETPQYCEEMQYRVIKSVHLANKKNLMEIKLYQGKIAAFLIDTYSEKVQEKGKTFDWGLAVKAKEYQTPVMLNCELGNSDLIKAAKMVRPEMIDLKAAVEKSPGIKDYNKLQDIMKRIREEL